MRAEALQRIAVGLSLPPEIVEWMASDPDATSGSMLQASGIGRSPDVLAAATRLGIMPEQLDEIGRQLTAEWLQQSMEAMGVDMAEEDR